MKISQTKVDVLMAEINEAIPDVQILYKDEPMPTWWLRALDIFIKIVGIFNKDFYEQWHTHIGNGIGGRWILLPGTPEYRDFSNYHVYSMLRHEYVHLRDQRARPLWFYLTYLILPLPLFFTGRAHWEYRGYAQDVITEYEIFGKITRETREWVINQFTSSLYLWMWSDPNKVEERVDSLIEGVKEGRYAGFYPDDLGWFR